MRKLIIFILIVFVLIVANYAGYKYFLGEKAPITSEETKTDTKDDDVIAPTSTNEVESFINSNLQTKILKEKLAINSMYKEIKDKSIKHYTVLAPTDVAFAEVTGKLATLSTAENKHMLRNLVLLESLSPEKLIELDGKQVDTLGGEKITIKLIDGLVEFEDSKGNTARIVNPNTQSSSNYVYLVDSVFIK